MSIGKYLTNIGVIAALFGALGTLRQTQSMPKDWRRFLIWGIWGAGLILALVSVAKQPQDEEYESEAKAAEQQAKRIEKAARRAR